MKNPLFLALATLVVLSIAAIPVLARSRPVLAFVSSSVAIFSMIFVAAVSMFPRLVPSSLDAAHSLTIYNASSSPRTLTVMLVIALIGVPIMLAYTAFVYRVFRGQVTVATEGYGDSVRAVRMP